MSQQTRVGTGSNPYYPNDPAKQKKLNHAIKVGYITRKQMTKDVFVYTLTTLGQACRNVEKMRNH